MFVRTFSSEEENLLKAAGLWANSLVGWSITWGFPLPGPATDARGPKPPPAPSAETFWGSGAASTHLRKGAHLIARQTEITCSMRATWESEAFFASVVPGVGAARPARGDGDAGGAWAGAVAPSRDAS